MAKYETTTEENKCIFCEIAKWTFPPLGNGLIYEDEKFMARLSPFPNTLWFSVVIPKKHYGSDVLAMPDEDLQEFVLVAKKIANKLVDYFDDVGRVGLIMEGTGIDHAHIKLMPMHGTGHMKQWIWKQYPSGKDDFFETYEGYIMSNDGPKADRDQLKALAEKIKETM